MNRYIQSAILCVTITICTTTLSADSPSHEEEVVRSAYAALSFLCSLDPVYQAASTGKDATQLQIDRAVSDAVPSFIIANVRTGTVASIASENWSTRFSPPRNDDPVVLAGGAGEQYYTDPDIPGAHWRFMKVHWSTDNSYTPGRLAEIQARTVGEAITSAAESQAWIAGKYSRYATFDVAVTFQGKTVGPYTATFLFGRDANGGEVVAPIDAVVAGQLLWEALRQNAYPSDLIRFPKLRENPVLNRWIQANTSGSCSSARSDLCCSGGKCSLAQSAVIKDAATAVKKKSE